MNNETEKIIVSETNIINYKQKENLEFISIILLAIITIIIILKLCKKFKKFRDFMKYILNFAIFFLYINEWIETFNYNWVGYTIIMAISLIIYIVFLFRLNNKTFRTSLSIIITSFVFILLDFLYEYCDIQIKIIGLIFVIIVLLLVTLAKISDYKKLSINKYMKSVIKEIVYIFKFLCALAISAIIGILFEKIIPNDKVSMLICITFTYLLNYYFNGLSKIKSENKEPNENKKTPEFYIIMIFAAIGVIAIEYALFNLIFTRDRNFITSNNYNTITSQFEDTSINNRT